jgi:hypothetical protein
VQAAALVDLGLQSREEGRPAAALSEAMRGREWLSFPAFEAVAEAVAATGPGTRGLVRFLAEVGGPEHLVNVVYHQDLGVMFLAGLDGGEAVLPGNPPSVQLMLLPLPAQPTFEAMAYVDAYSPPVHVTFNAGNLLRSVIDGGGRPAALSFTDEEQTTVLRQFVATAGTDGGPLSGSLLEAGRIADTSGRITRGTRLLRVTPPWDASVNGGGTFFVSLHGVAGPQGALPAFSADGRNGGKLAISGTTLARLLYRDPAFQEALSLGAVSITLISCGAGAPGGPTTEFAEELETLLGRPFPVYAGTSVVDTLGTEPAPEAGADPEDAEWDFLTTEDGILLEDGGHWRVSGRLLPGHARILADELARALADDWGYAQPQDEPGELISIEDRSETLGLVGDVQLAVDDGLDQDGTVLSIIEGAPLVEGHESPGIVWRAALERLRGEREARRRITRVNHGAAELPPEIWAGLGWRLLGTGSGWSDVVRDTTLDLDNLLDEAGRRDLDLIRGQAGSENPGIALQVTESVGRLAERVGGFLGDALEHADAPADEVPLTLTVRMADTSAAMMIVSRIAKMLPHTIILNVDGMTDIILCP